MGTLDLYTTLLSSLKLQMTHKKVHLNVAFLKTQGVLDTQILKILLKTLITHIRNP